MKKVLSFFSLFLILSAASFAQTSVSADEAENPNAPKFEWVEEVHDFGNIPQGIPVKHKFEFKNVGKEPLIVKNVQKTCGCTVTEWTKEPVLPGQSGFVEAQFNAARPGAFNKAITVQSNAKVANKKLFFKGTVDKKEETGSVPENKSIFAPNN